MLQISPTTQHAAYCAGVLRATLDPWVRFVAIDGKGKPHPISKLVAGQPINVQGPDGRVHQFPPGTQVSEINAKITALYGKPPFAAADLNALWQRSERYRAYLKRDLVRFVFGSSDSMVVAVAEVKSINAQGADEAFSSTRDFNDNRYMACKDKCNGVPSCLVECVGVYSVTASKVLGCQILPDGLPY